ncbi:hypothetical protein pETSU_109 [Edwardsiella phage pEt-SU]|uniref:Uncharacterized protein n=1 Tax=Edwardsiella phage pEt-SU TaxID=2562142 RepID=A0A4D6DWH7_9CAUD|nr:hypothetical protein HOV39_gp109 [Edwardsiella phage pEt-SU]QBZ70690.1 hypothetical protein pETSU_109 [Edwardsiella phage pEt-SU]
MAIEFESVDYAGCKLLVNSQAKVMIRKGKAFVYINDVKYDLPNLSDNERAVDEEIKPGVMTQNLDYSKDFTFEGVFMMFQNTKGYVCFVMKQDRRELPVVIRMAELPTIN